ncbi:MAG: hypothetical protein ABH824_05165 [Nanoarchaeota archaeon]|nr:hypothetical protein [Nanoarchaeota archaeon]MBU1632825.1 hypothetical protein [Nanoarchaeota archaeon]MBU1876482.1 hypothetical protein [Nanoarchaeota archaeon]
MKTLFVRPSHDDVTSYLFHYSKELIKESELKGFTTISKNQEDANRNVVVNVIEKNDFEFIMFNGHGNTSMICGHNDETIIQLGDNDNLLKRKVIYALSCSSAAELGRSVADEETTFIGYVDDFALGMDVYSQTSIHRDKRARLFLEPSNLLVKSLLKGNSAKSAVDKAKKMMKDNISKLRTDPFPDAKDYIPYLFNNYMVLEVLGNKKARLRE